MEYLLYDVFTSEPLLGNQLAVYVDGTGLDTPLMQRIAREMNLSETTFILPPEHAGTDVRVRIFTPARELPIAGHPTIGTAFALAHAGRIAGGATRVVFGLNIGPTPVDLEWRSGGLRFAWMTQPNPTFAPPRQDRDAVAAALALRQEDLAPELPVQEVSCGVPYLIVPLRDRDLVDRAVSDAGAFRRLRGSDGSSLQMYVVALTGSDRDGDWHRGDADTRSNQPSDRPLAADCSAYARMFAPEFGIVEDPATGSAAGPLGSYLVEHRAVSGREVSRISVDQGVAMGRASRIHVAIEGAAGAIRAVKVGGEAVLVGRGELLRS